MARRRSGRNGGRDAKGRFKTGGYAAKAAGRKGHRASCRKRRR